MFNINTGDSRAEFANRIFKLLWQKNNGDIDSVIIEAQPFIRLLIIHVKNIYELVEHEIPLIAYIAYSNEDAMTNFDYSKEELEKHLQEAKKACILFYS
jgi:hypothetical protein